MKPAIPITDKRFAYTPSGHTDIRKTFARIRGEMEQQKGTAGNGQAGHGSAWQGPAGLGSARHCKA